MTRTFLFLKHFNKLMLVVMISFMSPMATNAQEEDAQVEGSSAIEASVPFEERRWDMSEESQTAFLDAYAKQDGVIKRPSGLLIKILERGNGAFPRHGQKVTVHYEGKTIDGMVFDSSFARQRPMSFGVDAVIRGWTEALVLMTEGSKWEIALPANIAYGERGSPPRIPPNATLVFTVELLAVSN